ncbi:MAG: NAD-glutamate dehydrogenase [Candidatus Velamenicoccus archaeovorus]
MSSSDGGPEGGSNPVVQRVLERVGERAPAARAETVRAFARAYTRRLPEETLEEVSADELVGQVLGLFQLADGRDADPVAVRAFNPSLARDGYQSLGSVLETNTEDSPFLFDSVNEELRSRGLTFRRVVHPVIGTERGADGAIARVVGVRDALLRESVMHFEVDRRLSAAELADLEEAVGAILRDVRLVVQDFHEMRHRVERMIDAAKSAMAIYPPDEVYETTAFLEWLLRDNFVFLGYREYELIDLEAGRALHAVPGSGLGILSKAGWSSYEQPVPLSTIEPNLRARIEGGDLLIYSKTNRLATVHRRARMDYIGVRRVADDGRIVGELRLIGLFTSKAYMEPASRIPLLQRKLVQILEAEDLFEGSHDYKAVVTIFESFPKDELFAAGTAELRKAVMTLLHLQEQQQVRLLVRRDLYGRSVSLLVALPRDRFNTDLRRRLQKLFVERFQGSSVDYHLSLGESQLAAIHFTVHVREGEIPDISFKQLEQEVVELARTWDDRLRDRLVEVHGPERGRQLFERWGPRFPDYYKTSYGVEVAAFDVERFEALEERDEAFLVGLCNVADAGETLTRVRLYKVGGKIQLSDFVPTLEALGLRVVEEVPTHLVGVPDGRFLHDFGVLGADERPLDVEEAGPRIAECIDAVWRGLAESDSLNRLVVTAGLDWRRVEILRAYRKYHHRVNLMFTSEYKNDAFAAHPDISAKLVRLFELRFDPDRPRDDDAVEALRREIVADLDAVTSLEQDRILRNHLQLIDATVRTNAFVPDRTRLVFKLRSADVPEMPRPTPLYEIFVYSMEMEAVHLRGGKVARGGIRWSERRQDFRTEVLGLMKAQMVKNAVIVPTGSKGGFILKRRMEDPTALRQEIERQYVTFMRGLLDVTDNLVDGKVVHPEHVVIHDEDDPYLVVAADKGTAPLSDTANAVAAEYGFWLGDAFASGGSAGYDHKALGITARGAWESVKRHFRELGTDPSTDPITVVGIGDMSGDVFGNGMLMSDHLRLVAAFDHRHVFLDPEPDPAVGFAERKRLSQLAGSSWDDYDRSKISAGGGVWPRSAKAIPLSPEARAALGVDERSLPPDRVIQAILRAPVDLLWNGGIGTYVKASEESHAEVGDRGNDGVRVDGRELRCRVVAEGGNLGFTQRGRIEYARSGGLINADFIDNSAGVDCSDHEVNLKILLGTAMQRGELTLEDRNRLLHEVEQDVVRHVLYDNFLQAQILSQEAVTSAGRMEAFEDLMEALEAEGLLDRELEALPKADEMAERRRAGRGMARPELAVLLAYAKISLTNALLASSLPDSQYLAKDLLGYFPPKVVERFGHLVSDHPLRRELVATIVANDVVNSQGITFVSRLVTETGAEASDVVRAYRIARDVTDAVARWEAIEALGDAVEPAVLDELMADVDRMVEVTARWYLGHAPGQLGRAIDAHREPFRRFAAAVPEVVPEAWREERERLAWRLMDQGVPEELARRHAFQPALVHGPNAIDAAEAAGRSVEEAAEAFFAVGDALYIDWLEERLGELTASSRWHRWAIQSMEDDLLTVRRQVAERILREAPGVPVAEAVRAFLDARNDVSQRLARFMRSLAMEGVGELAAMTVAVRQIRSLAT